MSWNPDTHNHDVHRSNENDSSPLQSPHGSTMFRNEGDSVDDDLHQELDLKDPAEHEEKQRRNSAVSCQCEYDPCCRRQILTLLQCTHSRTPIL